MIARTNLRLDSRLARKPEKFSCAIPSVFMILFTLRVNIIQATARLILLSLLEALISFKRLS